MKYFFQITIILLISLAGELLNYLIPLPIPGSIYGFVIVFVLLLTGVLKLSQIKDTADFLISIMPCMFIPAGVGIINSFDSLRPVLIPIAFITFVSTFVVMAVSGKITEFVVKRKK